MHRPSTSDLLDGWERGLSLAAGNRALALLAADVGTSLEESARLPVGERDARLLNLREWAFGPRIVGATSCQSCGAELELEFDAEDVREAPHPTRGPEEPGQDIRLRVGGYDIRFRLPDSVAQAEAAKAGSLEAARGVLLRHCVLRATQGGELIDPDLLPPDVVDGIEAAMAERDPQADVRIAISCAECGHESEAAFDIGTYLWREVDQWARRVLVEIASLAAAFGWTEREVLGLSPSRREAYLELVGL